MHMVSDEGLVLGMVEFSLGGWIFEEAVLGVGQGGDFSPIVLLVVLLVPKVLLFMWLLGSLFSLQLSTVVYFF